MHVLTSWGFCGWWWSPPWLKRCGGCLPPACCLALPPTPPARKLAARCGNRGRSNGDSGAVSIGRSSRSPSTAVPWTPSLCFVALLGAAASQCESRWLEDLLLPSLAMSMLCAPVGETTLQVDIPGPTSRRQGEVPHRRLGMAAWTHLANGEGSCLPLCGLDAEK